MLTVKKLSVFKITVNRRTDGLDILFFVFLGLNHYHVSVQTFFTVKRNL